MNTHLRFQPGAIAKATRLPMAIVVCLALTLIFSASAGIFVNTGSLNVARCNHTATLLPNGKVLVVGGFDMDQEHRFQGGGNHTLSSAELYDPATGTWTLTGPMSTGRGFQTTTLLPNGKVLVSGGGNNGNPFTSAELYDPATGVWTPTGALNTPRYEHTATLLPSGKVLVAGGNAGGGLPVPNAELYDPATEEWTETGVLNTPRFGHTATLLTNGQVLVVAGIAFGGFTSNAELYDPNTETWTTTNALNPGRLRHTATLLQNGKIMVAGGYNNSGGLSNADLFDSATGIWTPTGLLNSVRAEHTATLLPNGKVLVTGGDLDPDTLFSSSELYDPSTGTWATRVAMDSTRFNHTATLLSDGKVLIAGGEYFISSRLGNIFVYVDSGVLSSAALYEPTPIALIGTIPTNNAIQLSFTNDAGSAFAVLATTNLSASLSNWTILGNTTEVAPGQFQFTDLQATNFTQRFYRVRSQ